MVHHACRTSITPVSLNALEVIDDGNTQTSQGVQDSEDDDIQRQVSKKRLQVMHTAIGLGKGSQNCSKLLVPIPLSTHAMKSVAYIFVQHLLSSSMRGSQSAAALKNQQCSKRFWCYLKC